MSLVSALRAALLRNELAAVKTLVAQGADVNAFFENHQTPLHLAVLSGNKDCVKFLLLHGAQVIPSSQQQESVISLSARLNNVDMLRLLLPDRISHKKQTLGKDFRNSAFDMTPMYTGILHGNKEVLDFFQERGVDINCKNEDGLTLVQLAALQGHVNILRYLVEEYKADIHVVDVNGFSVLYTAASQGHGNIVKYQIEELHFDVNERSLGGETVLHLSAAAGYIGQAQYLQERKANIELATEQGFTPLHTAVASGHLDLVKSLVVDFGANIDTFDKDDNTPLHIAAQTGNLEMCQLLVSRGSATGLGNLFNKTPAEVAKEHMHFHISKYIEKYAEDGIFKNPQVKSAFELCNDGRIDDLEEFIGKHSLEVNTVQSDGNTLLHAAAQRGMIHMVEMLLEKKADVQVGNSPLIAAALSGQMDLVKFQVDGQRMAVNSRGTHSSTPLLAACRSCHYDLVQYLLDRKADVAAVDVYGNSSACIAAFNGYQSIVRLLIDHKASVNSMTSFQDTLLHQTLQSEQDSQLEDLLEMKADPNLVNIDGYSPLHHAVRSDDTGMAALQLHYHADATLVSKKKENAQTYACLNGNVDMFDMLIEESSIDPTLPLPCGSLPIALAGQHGHFELVFHLHNQYKCHLDVRLKEGKTLLHHACQSGDLSAVKRLQSQGLSLDSLDHNHSSPLLDAIEYDHVHIVKYLATHGANVVRKNKLGQCALELSVTHKAEKIFLYLVDAIPDKLPVNPVTRFTPLHIAAEKGYLEIVQVYISKRVDMDVGREQGFTPQHVACGKNQIHIVKLLLRAGADVHIADNKGRSPLRIAHLTGSSEVSAFLKEYQPSPKALPGEQKGFLARLFGWN